MVTGISLLAAGEGFEPSHTESESAVLPLHNPAMFLTNISYYTGFLPFVNPFCEFFLKKKGAPVGTPFFAASLLVLLQLFWFHLPQTLVAQTCQHPEQRCHQSDGKAEENVSQITRHCTAEDQQ